MPLPRRGIGQGVAGAFGAVLWALGAPSPASDHGLAIQHQSVRCLVSGKYPRLDACVEPLSRVARARVYFRGEGVSDWHYVEMTEEAGCFRGVLPRPRKSLKRVNYYVSVTDRDFAEARTEEFAPEVVPNEQSCPDGVVAPFLSSATVVVGGAAALPAGFVGGGVIAGVSATAVAAGAAVVGGGAAAAVIVGGGEEPTTTTTTTTLPPTTTTTTTTTTLGGCATDSAPPEVEIQSPADNAEIGAQVNVVVVARDPGPVSNGIREVRITADEQGGARTAAIATLAGPGPAFGASWAVPPCLGPQDRWYIDAEAEDGCSRTTRARIRVRRSPSSCAVPPGLAAPAGPSGPGERQALGMTGAPGVMRAAPPGVPATVWTSELAVPGGRGQVAMNGADVVFPGAGRHDLTLPARPGPNRLEAVLVEGAGPGRWRLTLAGGAIRPGSLRVVAGDVIVVGPETATFRLRGRPGERVVLALDVD